MALRLLVEYITDLVKLCAYYTHECAIFKLLLFLVSTPVLDMSVSESVWALEQCCTHQGCVTVRLFLPPVHKVLPSQVGI